MSIPEWFALGAGAALATAAWWWCVREGMWNIFAQEKNKPSVAGGLIGGTIMFWLIPVWGPVFVIVRAWDHVDARRLLTERVFPRPGQ